MGTPAASRAAAAFALSSAGAIATGTAAKSFEGSSRVSRRRLQSVQVAAWRSANRTAWASKLSVGDAVVLETPVAVGAPDAPTPTGTFAVIDRLQSPDPASPYGPFALGLSAHSDTFSEFAGGDGQIGIHGTDDPSSIGQAVSHGCVRVPNDVVARLAELLPLGTPVIVA